MNKVQEMIKEREKLSEKLNKKNKTVFTDIVCYLKVSSLVEEEQEEVISDILEMFLRYQKEGKDIEEAIGNDYKAFCDSIIEAANPKKVTFNKAIELFQIIIEVSFILLSIDFVFNYLPGIINGKEVGNYQLSLSQVLTIIILSIIGNFIVNYVGKNSFKFSKTKRSKKADFLFVLFGVVFYWAMKFAGKLSKYVLFSINWYCILFIMGAYWVYRLTTKYIVK